MRGWSVQGKLFYVRWSWKPTVYSVNKHFLNIYSMSSTGLEKKDMDSVLQPSQEAKLTYLREWRHGVRLCGLDVGSIVTAGEENGYSTVGREMR